MPFPVRPRPSSHIEPDPSPIPSSPYRGSQRGSHREVNPVRCPSLLEDQFVEVPPRPVSDVEQYPRIPYLLLRPHTADIYCAACQVIARWRSSAPHIHLLRPIPARNDHRNGVFSFLLPPSSILDSTIQPIIRIPQILQPSLTEIPQVLNRYPRRDIPVQRVITRLRQLPERKVLGESDTFINAYFLHNPIHI